MKASAESCVRSPETKQPGLSWRSACVLALAAVVSFHLAYTLSNLAILVVVFQFSLFQLAALRTVRQSFYLGVAIGMAIYAPQLSFFWNIFQGGALPLWIILSCWLAFFLVLGRACWRRFGFVAWAVAAPFVWTGLEYFRSELYYLRFSWLTVGYVFSNSPALHYFSAFGVYGTGFVLMSIVSLIALLPRLGLAWKVTAGIGLVLTLLFPILVSRTTANDRGSLKIAGIQLEFAIPAEIRSALDDAIKKFPKTDLFVLSEYSFMGPVPDLIKRWCRKNAKYLMAGGEEPLPNRQFYNVAYVIGPDGSVVFQQAKCVPVQLMKDGVPAARQEVWNSPWGKIGVCICYDASYTRVTDELVRQGARALIIPTMDVSDWGERQHQLHCRIGPMRAAEYGLPIFRLCSSGISQVITKSGQVTATAPYPGTGAFITGDLTLPDHAGRIPPDRRLAQASVLLTGLLTCSLVFRPAPISQI